MIKLVYDIRCGFKQLYVTEKDCAWYLDSFFDPETANWDEDEPMPTAEDFYEEVKRMTQAELRECFEDNGTLACIKECEEETCAKTYLKDVCKEQNCFPGFTEVYNLRVEYDPAVEVRFAEDPEDHCLVPHYYRDGVEIDLDRADPYRPWMKAGEAMEILGVSRKVLSTYVKKGLIKVEPNPAGGQYRYDSESVLALAAKAKH